MRVPCLPDGWKANPTHRDGFDAALYPHERECEPLTTEVLQRLIDEYDHIRVEDPDSSRRLRVLARFDEGSV